LSEAGERAEKPVLTGIHGIKVIFDGRQTEGFIVFSRSSEGLDTL
jgi:hypothetical protein